MRVSKLVMAASALATVAGWSGSAWAAKPISEMGGTACQSGDISPGASDCSGWFTNNLVKGNNKDANAFSAQVLDDWLGTNYASDGLTWLKDIDIKSGNVIDFDIPLYGQTLIAIHAGAAKGNGGIGYNGTAFFLFDAGNLADGLDSITFNRGGLSNARLFYTGTPGLSAVPEPATWAMMILGFGLVGGVMRRRQRQTVRYAFT
jgi:hypothetical protein